MLGGPKAHKGELRLVYPGRYVEIHHQPITAAEVMRKNPRHCVARPDVFRFPWIVVRPESILSPGKVFYVVPHRTLHGLLKAMGPHGPCPARKSQSPKIHQDRQGTLEQAPRPPSWAGMTPEHQGHGLGAWKRRQAHSWARVGIWEEDPDGSHIRRSLVETKRKSLKEFKYETAVGLGKKVGPHSRGRKGWCWGARAGWEDEDSCSSRIQRPFPDKNKKSVKELEYESVESGRFCRRGREWHYQSSDAILLARNDNGEGLQSCMRKPNSARKFLKLEVTFASPIITRVVEPWIL
ncbi:hypothetical protein NMG60_11014220 [Bertholletia excelsa]